MHESALILNVTPSGFTSGEKPCTESVFKSHLAPFIIQTHKNIFNCTSLFYFTEWHVNMLHKKDITVKTFLVYLETQREVQWDDGICCSNDNGDVTVQTGASCWKHDLIDWGNRGQDSVRTTEIHYSLFCLQTRVTGTLVNLPLRLLLMLRYCLSSWFIRFWLFHLRADFRTPMNPP